MHSTSTEKIAALLVSVSFVNISRTLPPAVSSAECSCLVVGSRSGSYPWSRRRAGSGLALLRSVHATRNYRILLLCEGIYVPQGTKLAEELPRTLTKKPYEKVSSAGQPPHHEATHGSIYERFAART